MALFKIEKGLGANLFSKRPDTHEGWCYFTTDEGKMYIDIQDGTGTAKNPKYRVALNAATADVAQKLLTENVGSVTRPVYFEGGIPVICNDFLPLTEGPDKKISIPFGLIKDIGYGTELPEEGFEGQMFFLAEEKEPLYVPEGGSKGQVLIKDSDVDGEASWKELVALPKGGNSGEVLIKNSATDGDASWKELVALPKGGSAGQVLIKNSTTDGDASWKQANYLPLTGGTVNGKVNIGAGLQLWSDGEGGNIRFYCPNRNSNNIYEFDNESDRLRLYYCTDGGNGATGFQSWSWGTDGSFTASKVYGAVWNDYAEFRTQKEHIEPGYCVASANNGQVYKTTEKFQACDGIVSDTFGFAIGETDECKTPLAVAGRVLAYCEGNRYDYQAGDTVCAGPKGKVMKMTREEIREWPDRIVGIVSEIPEYETWGSGDVPVNGRIWIKVK